MKKLASRWTSQLTERFSSSTRGRRSFRCARFEPLETRRLLSVSPTLEPLDDVTVLGGAPLHIGLNGLDADGDSLSYTVEIQGSNNLTATIPEGNRSLWISVDDYGDMVFELFESRAPNTTARIIELAQAGFYDDLTFHRVIEDFMIQGGDPQGDGTGGTGFDFDDEFHPQLQHTSAGMLSMAKTIDDTNDSQFFITDSTPRHLDFNHSIFGMMTQGWDVLDEISAVATDEGDRPIDDVVMGYVDVFNDTQNAVLMLSAPEGASGTADVTVTVDDGNGNTAQETFHVTITPDTTDSPPFLLPVDDLYTTVDTPISFSIEAIDVETDAGIEGNEPFYASATTDNSEDFQLETDGETGLTTVTPPEGAVGVYSILVGVRALQGGDWDTQEVPVFIQPGAPGEIELLDGSDTGVLDDGITSLNNNGGNATLGFRVHDVVDGAEVTLFADGEEIGKATASGDSVVIVTDGDYLLTDGAHSITAVQSLLDQDVDVGNRYDEQIDLVSEESAAVQVTIDTIAPAFTSNPITGAAIGVPYAYDAQTDVEQADGTVTYSLTTSPAGMLINSTTGQVTWTPQASQAPGQSVVIRAADAAGNTNQQSYVIVIDEPPQLDPIADRQIAEDSTLTLTAVADGNGDTLVFDLAGDVPAGASIDAATGEFSWTPTEAQGPGTYTITVRVTNEANVAVTEAFDVTVNENNEAPSLDPIFDITIDEGEPLDFFVGVTDPDLPANDLTFSLNQDAPAGVAIDPTTGRFTFTPDESQGGETYSLTVHVADEEGAFDETSFSITVDEVDSPPVFSPVDRQVLMRGETLTVTVEASDPDVPTNAIRYSLESGAPEGAAIDSSTGLLTWTVPQDFAPGTIDVTVRATELVADDATGASAVTTVEIVVYDPSLELLAAAMSNLRSGPAMVAPPPTLPTAMLFDPPGERKTEPLTFDVLPDPRISDVLSGSGLFGTQIGPDTNLSSGRRSQSDEDTDRKPKEDGDSSDETNTPDDADPSVRAVPEANDAVIASHWG